MSRPPAIPSALSLRLRILLILAAVLLASAATGIGAAAFLTREAVGGELSAALIGARQTVSTAFEDLPRSDHPERDLRQLVATFDANRHVSARLLDAEGRTLAASSTPPPAAAAPALVVRLYAPAPAPARLAVPGRPGGISAIVLEPTAALDVADAWRETGAVAALILVAAAGGLFLVHLAIRAGLSPLTALATELAQIAEGDFGGRLVVEGPAEVAAVQSRFNEMAGRLAASTDRNRLLTRQLLTIQEEERADIARDLHDDIGPHLFAVAMDAEVIASLTGPARPDVLERVRAIQASASHMQRQVRDLLSRLRSPLAAELGLGAALEELIEFWRQRRPDVAFRLEARDAEEGVPEEVRTAAFRLVQEAVSNAIRHAGPSLVEVRLRIGADGELMVAVGDDGGAPASGPVRGGLGLIGMRERVDALGGALSYGPRAGGPGWLVEARLPPRGLKASLVPGAGRGAAAEAGLEAAGAAAE
jgi:two-component system sensor histidine kinase UhpB